MKRKIIVLFITIMLLTSGIVYSKDMENRIEGKCIVIDPGHGGKDSGTSVGNVLEKDLNLNIAIKLKEELNKHGVDVLLTRDGDYDLSSPNVSRRKKSDFDNRIKLINSSKADMYLSIHINYLDDNRYYGAQTFYTQDNDEIAELIQKEFKNNLKSPLDVKELSDSIYMYKQLTIPGVLIECGFISNVNERFLLNSGDYQDRIVDSIVNGLIKYYGIIK